MRRKKNKTMKLQNIQGRPVALEDLHLMNEHVQEFLQFHNMNETLEMFRREVKSRQMPLRLRNDPAYKERSQPRLHRVFSEKRPMIEDLRIQKQFHDISKKYRLVIHAAKQMFSVSMNFMQSLSTLPDIINQEPAIELIETFKVQLGKYHKTIQAEGNLDGHELVSETVMKEHKEKFLRFLGNGNVESLVEVLLSLRVNALQIAPELRKNLVYELIRNDIFDIEAKQSFEVILKVLDIEKNSVRHAISSLISVISSTLKGIEYLTTNDNMVVIERVIHIMKSQADGSVTQRFCIATLQKCSIKDKVIPTMIDKGLIDWVLNLLRKSLKEKIHVFCLDFSSAMLANIIHSSHTLEFLKQSKDIARRVRRFFHDT